LDANLTSHYSAAWWATIWSKRDKSKAQS
jgi:hypothetical protein